MTRETGKTDGFTLIELLIVVAIIAILAAIAVPNFLEAQVRAKVSRVKNDLRSLATAQEAYYVDWNSYTKYDRGGDDWWPDGSPVYEGWKMLTSPVAYTTSIPHDPFGPSRTTPGAAAPSAPLYELGAGAAGVGPSADPPGGQWDRPMIRASDSWDMSSKGPDHLDQTRAPFYEWDYPWDYPGNGFNPNLPANVDKACGAIYDPTNGTVSTGDILRFGGQKPSGMVFDVFYSASAR